MKLFRLASAALAIGLAFTAYAEAPRVNWRSPRNGDTVSGTLSGQSCLVDAKAPRAGMDRVQFSVDSTPIGTDTVSPWYCTLDTRALPNGSHTLLAEAFSAKGERSTASITVNVQNAAPPPPPPPAPAPKAISTFHSIGLYWTPPANPGASGCSVQYRIPGDAAWRDALPMWYDARNNECRGSIVNLTPATTYDVQIGMAGQAPVTLTASTWSESFPVAKTVVVPSGSQTFTISEGGTASGYVLYVADAAGTTIDVAGAALYNVDVRASYVIVRGLTLKNAQQDGIRLQDGVHDVVIEENDISGWGRYRATLTNGQMVGIDRDSGVRAYCTTTPGLERVTIQRNRIHDPRWGANSWSFGHPEGPQGVTFSYCGGNHVIRYNEITSSEGHYYNDGLSGEDNFSATGFPNADSDIYGNIIRHAWDDAIEAEGGDRNVRIWGNYIDQTTTGVATTVAHWGPVYIFRNVYNRSRQLSEVSLDSDQRNVFAKSGSTSSFGNGRRYVLHNTVLQADPPLGTVYSLGAGGGVAGAGTSQPLTNTVTRNNILHIWKSWWNSISEDGGSGNDFDNDLFNGNIAAYRGAEPSGIVGTPIYQPGNGWVSESGGMYQLDPSSPGYDRGVRLPNFNDDYVGAAPDIGAHEAGSAPMRFGVTVR
jgi:hypothetical protein